MLNTGMSGERGNICVPPGMLPCVIRLSDAVIVCVQINRYKQRTRPVYRCVAVIFFTQKKKLHNGPRRLPDSSGFAGNPLGGNKRIFPLNKHNRLPGQWFINKWLHNCARTGGATKKWRTTAAAVIIALLMCGSAAGMQLLVGRAVIETAARNDRETQYKKCEYAGDDLQCGKNK